MAGTDPLERLVDIRLPEPPTDSTAAIALLCLAVLVALGVAALASARLRARWYRPAVAAIAEAETMAPDQALFRLAVLVRRLALTLEPNGPGRTAEGNALKAHLDRLLRTRFFSRGEGAAIVDDLYGTGVPGDAAVKRIAVGLRGVLRRRSLLPW